MKISEREIALLFRILRLKIEKHSIADAQRVSGLYVLLVESGEMPEKDKLSIFREIREIQNR
ncbi:MAG: hypothetical protein E6Q89_00650 [Bacteroidia bacterium]|nr:MAG: hypothetical protein E6Q89_00650 [Bacteroidia bacterium]